MMGQYHFYSNTLWNDEVEKKDYLICEFYTLKTSDNFIFFTLGV